MNFLYLIPFYTRWHYTEGIKDLSRNWKNFLSFILYFFSLGFLTRTLFAPFGRLNEEYKKGTDAEAFLETLVANTLMRVIGFILRIVVIIIGLLTVFVVILLGPIIFVLWVLAPFIILFLFTFGVTGLLI